MEMLSFYYFLIFLAFFVFSKHFLGRKKKNLPPTGPLSLPIIGHLYLFKKPLHRTLAKISARYGPILYLQFGSRPVLLVSSPSAAEECFTTNDIIFANRPRLIAGKHVGNNYSSIVWAPYGSHWRNLRRISALEIFSSHRLQMSLSIRADEVCALVRRLAGQSLKIVELKSVFFELTLNVMMMMIAGKRYYGENMEDLEEARRFREIVTETFVLGGASNIGDFLPVLMRVGLKGLEKRFMRLQQRRFEFMQELIEEHRTTRTQSSSCLLTTNEERKKTMIDVLLSLQETEPEYYTDEIIKDILLEKSMHNLLATGIA